MPTISNVSDIVLIIVVGFGLAAALYGDVSQAPSTSQITWPLVALALVGEVALVVYVVLWRRSRQCDTEIVFREHEVWLPASGMRLKGRTLRYRDIQSVDVSGPGSGRRIHVRWTDGSLRYGFNFVDLQQFARELQMRVERARRDD